MKGKREETLKLEARVKQLRKSGWTYDSIAAHLKRSKARVHQIITGYKSPNNYIKKGKYIRNNSDEFPKELFIERHQKGLVRSFILQETSTRKKYILCEKPHE